MKPYSIGIDIGGTKCSVVLGRTREAESLPDDPILDKDRFPTKAEMGPDYIIGNLCASLRGLLKAHSIRPDEIHAIGVSCGGPLDLSLIHISLFKDISQCPAANCYFHRSKASLC